VPKPGISVDNARFSRHRAASPVTESELLQFPTDYPIKVLGRPSAELRTRVHAIMLRHAPALDPDKVTERPSANGNFVAISYIIRAESREQIVALATDLKNCPEVLMIL
jgi:putative lipoic acid-binding regulatory protein